MIPIYSRIFKAFYRMFLLYITKMGLKAISTMTISDYTSTVHNVKIKHAPLRTTSLLLDLLLK